MRRRLTRYGLLALGALLCVSVSAQQPTTVSGSVKNNKSKEAISAVSVTVKGGAAGTFTDDKGNFRFSTVQKLPFTIVFSSVGYINKEVSVTADNQVIDASIEPSFVLGDEVVVAASRVPEKILESPVSIERIGTAAIRNTAAANYYDMITNLKGVDVVMASLTFRSVGTRGFNVSGNNRLNQLVDGMDNQAPGLNFSVGSVISPTELDVDNIELLPGASSALYGSGGMNGTVLINSKNPFKYQGLSFQIKQGVKDVDHYQRDPSPYYDWSFRWAKKIGEKFAFKINAQFIQAKDWVANQTDNYSRTTGTPNGQVIPGSRSTDPGYDGVNVYGDETNFLKDFVGSTSYLPLLQAGFNSFQKFIGYIGTVGGVPGAALNPILASISPTQNVSRTGYDEKDVIDPTTLNVKLTGGVYYKLSDKTEASFIANWGTGNSVYTGSDRYSLKDLKMGQYKLEVKSKNWFVRAYTTHENSGSSFNATVTTRLFNEAWKSSGVWYQQYAQTYLGARLAGMGDLAAQNTARAAADVGRPTGFIGNNPLFKQVAGTPISQGGGLFLDRSRLNVLEGQYNLTNDLGLDKSGTDLLVGVSLRQYVLNSEGTLFADAPGSPIKINEFGTYAQLSQKLLNDVLKLTVSGRYDKNTNFTGRFTPRASAVVKLAKDHNLRFSYQEAYRFPTTQNQWINLTIGGGTRLIGGLQQVRDLYSFGTNPLYTAASVQAYRSTGNVGLLQQQQFGEFKAESSRSFEAGYKGLVAQKLLIDVYAYWSTYKDFISSIIGYQARNAAAPAGTGVLYDATSINYSVAVNTPGNVNTSGWGASVEYLLPHNFSVSGNLYHDQIGALPTGFVAYFNTPKYRVNMALNNSGFGKDNRYGFSVVYRWTNTFFYEGTFAVGQLPFTRTVDAMVSYKLPSTKSMIKIGGTNIFNKYYRTGFGSAQIGGLYYVSYAYNIL